MNPETQTWGGYVMFCVLLAATFLAGHYRGWVAGWKDGWTNGIKDAETKDSRMLARFDQRKGGAL